MGEGDNARERRRMAESNLYDAQQRLRASEQHLAVTRAQHDASQAEQEAANILLTRIKLELNERRAHQSYITSLAKKLTNIETHLQNVLAPSAVSQEELHRLLDFNLVMEPLNAIYHEMLESNIMESFGFEISAETSHKIQTNLKKLTEKLTKTPLNTMETIGNSQDFR